MAVALVGTGTFIKSTANGNATTLTFSTGGAASGDIVIASWTHTRGALTANLRSSAGTAYTPINTLNNGNLGILVAYRQLTSSETTVTSCATGSAQDSIVLAAIVLRGQSTAPLVNDNSTTGTSSNPNSPSLTEATPNSAFIVTASILANTSLTAPSGFGSAVSTGATDTRSCAGALAYLSTNGTVDPSSWAGGASAAWIANTITIGSTEAIPFTWLMMSGTYPDIVPYKAEPMIGY